MILKPKPPIRVIFDLDSTVLVLYGKQAMARIGYNPKKWGLPSYHPLLCFNGILLQSHQLVQTTLFANGVSEYNA